ncbi:MAG TPA: peptidoglycan bridge formation glycyltransferase FemA/FemB family protein [Candidatus Vogelbacteria bacterium]|nr:peptidoglycan bridge formation glycyltransferase FemA/FemB family protein [Candidatus Vogelbacteria bacterium]
MLTEEKQLAWDKKLINQGAHFVQSELYLDWQKNTGQKVFEVEIETENSETLFRGVEKPLPFGQKFIYSAHGPFINNISDMENIRKKILELGQKKQALFIRYDLVSKIENTISLKGSKLLTKEFYRRSSIQPRYEWILPTFSDETEALKKLPGRTRYFINKARRGKIEIEISYEPIKYLEDFWQIMNKTSTRQSFCLHPKEYYQTALSSSTPTAKPFLTIARQKEKIIAIHFNIIFGQKAFYVFGGSKENDSGCSYLLIWEGLNEVSKQSCLEFNLGGINGPDNLNPEWQNLTLFKKKFPGKMFCHNPTYDLPIRPLPYSIYYLSKKMKMKK